MRKNVLFGIVILFGSHLFAQLHPVIPWKEVGPIKFPTNDNGPNSINGIGRTSQIKFHATDSLTMYAVTSWGGLFKSIDGAKNWFNLKGSLYLPIGGQGSICVDYENDSIIYLGAGDVNYYTKGSGVWKSTDGGNTFVQKNQGMGLVIVVEILQSPTNRNVLIAATSTGIYKSIDAGNTWIRKTPELAALDMEMKPGSNGRVLYCTTDIGLYRSLDYGETWTDLMNTGGLYIPSGGSAGGMRVAVCPADSNVVYIGMVKNYGTIFKSINGGTDFSVMKDSAMPNLTGYYNVLGNGGQGNFNFDINCDPKNPSILYLVSHRVLKSTNSGVSWTQMTEWFKEVHTDMHYIAFSPHNKNKHFNANDGGIFLTMDGGISWNPTSDGLSATEVGAAASSNLDYNTITIGTQDNGEIYRKDTTEWRTIRGGDFYPTMSYDWVDPRRIYYGSGSSRMVDKSNNKWLNFPFSGDATFIKFHPKAKNTALIANNKHLWISRNIQSLSPTWTLVDSFVGGAIRDIAWSIKDSNRVYAINADSKVYRTDNLYAITPTFLSSATPAGVLFGASIAVIANNDNIVYVSCGSNIYRSANAGNTWSNITFNYPDVTVRELYNDPFTVNESIYLRSLFSIYFKTKTMTSWQNLTQNLPTNTSMRVSLPYAEAGDKSEMRVAYYGKGLWSIPMATERPPFAQFDATLKKPCDIGKTITFLDSSIRNPTSWNWSFPGGTPSTSILQNPTIGYNTPGLYDVSLTVSNAVGSSTETKSAFITVKKADTALFSENFESGTLPSNWTIFDDLNDEKKWELDSTYSAYGIGSKSYKFNNTAGKALKDAIITSTLTLKKYDSVWLSFDRAHAPHFYSPTAINRRDSLRIGIDNSCGTAPFIDVWLKGYTDLATAPKVTLGATFTPQTSQWKKDTINLTPFAGQDISLMISTFKSNQNTLGGQVIYIDNIKVWGRASVVKDTTFSAVSVIGTSYLFGTQLLTVSGTYRDTIRTVNTGQDSIRRTLILTFIPAIVGAECISSLPPLNILQTTDTLTVIAPNFSQYRWFLNGSLIQTTTTKSIRLINAGTYKIQGVDAGACMSIKSQPYYYSSTCSLPLARYGFPATIKVEPAMPTQITVTWCADIFTQNMSVNIYDLNCRLVYTEMFLGNLGTKNIPKSSLTCSQCVVQLLDAEGQIVEVSNPIPNP